MEKIIKVLCILYVIASLFVGEAMGVGTEGAAAAEVPAKQDTAPGVYQNTANPNGRPLDYSLYIPEGVSEGMPVIIWLHGAGFVNQPHRLNDAGAIRAAQELGEKRFIIIQPCTTTHDWTDLLDLVVNLADSIVDELHCDPNRIILTGYSLGAMGTWNWADRMPEKWAAVIPVAEKPITVTNHLANAQMPIWAIWGEFDVYPIKSSMELTIKECEKTGTHRDVRYTEVPGADHNAEIAWHVYTQDVFDWAYTQTE